MRTFLTPCIGQQAVSLGEGRRMDRNERRTIEVADTQPSRAAMWSHPVHPMLVTMPIGLLIGAFVADLIFWGGGSEFFAQMALWLVGGGLLTGLLAALAGLVDFASIERARSTDGWIHAVGNGLVMGVAAVNVVVRLAGDAADVVLPWGLLLSAVTAVGLAITGWYGGELSYRHMIGVSPHGEHRLEAVKAGQEHR